VRRKKKVIGTAGANGGELDLADAQEDTGAEDANPERSVYRRVPSLTPLKDSHWT